MLGNQGRAEQQQEDSRRWQNPELSQNSVCSALGRQPRDWESSPTRLVREVERERSDGCRRLQCLERQSPVQSCQTQRRSLGKYPPRPSQVERSVLLAPLALA